MGWDASRGRRRRERDHWSGEASWANKGENRGDSTGQGRAKEWSLGFEIICLV